VVEPVDPDDPVQEWSVLDDASAARPCVEQAPPAAAAAAAPDGEEVAPKVRVVTRPEPVPVPVQVTLTESQMRRLLKLHDVEAAGGREELWALLQQTLAEHEQEPMEVQDAGLPSSAAAAAQPELPTGKGSTSSSGKGGTRRWSQVPAKGRGKGKPPLDRGATMTPQECAACPHAEVTWHRNQHAKWTKCKECGLRMTYDSDKEHVVREGHTPREEPKKPTKGRSKVATAAPQDECAHKEVTKGSNQHGSWEKCKSCGKRLSYTDKGTGSTTKLTGLAGL